MIEYFKDRETGEIYPNQTVLCEYSVFWRDNMLREEDKTPNVVCVLTGDWSGVYLEDDSRKARFSPIRFLLANDNPRQTLDDYLNVTVEMKQSHGAPVRDEQVEKVRWDAFSLYKYKLLDDTEFLKSLPKPPFQLLNRKKLNDLF